MINWEEMSNLHVILKLRQILTKWFGVELFYANEHYRVQSSIFDKNYRFQNYFMKVQMTMNYGHEYLNQDVEKTVESLLENSDSFYFYESFFPGVKGVVSKIVIEGEFVGTIFAYPFVSDQLTTEEEILLKKKMIECGGNENDTQVAVTQLRRLDKTARDYLHELVALVSQEIVTFHNEIEKREARILELN